MMLINPALLALCLISVQGRIPHCDLPGQDGFISVPIKQSASPTVCDPMSKTLPLAEIPDRVEKVQCAYYLNGRMLRALIHRRSNNNYAQWEFCRDVGRQKFDGHRPNNQSPNHQKLNIPQKQLPAETTTKGYPNQYNFHIPTQSTVDSCKNGKYNGVFYENDDPSYCIISDLGPHHGKCVDTALYYHIKNDLANKPFRYDKSVDNTIEYKRYILKNRLLMYYPYETKPSQEYMRQMLEHPFDRSPMKWLNDHAAHQFEQIFVDAANELSYKDINGPMNVEVAIWQWKTYPAKHLCNLMLKYFPISNTKLFSQHYPRDCPDSTKMVGVCPPKRCKILPDHADFVGFRDYCLSFEDAEKLLNTKNNLDEDVDPGHSRMMENEDPWWSSSQSVWSVLRLNQIAHQAKKYYQPQHFYWSTLRSQNISIQKILSDIQTALGYEGDERRVFTIQNPWNHPRGPVKVNLSVNAFCRALLEMIPFSRRDLRTVRLQNHCT
uniref:Uncharacterized protein n=1 Tax=Romanomermis culicivorax TaxID=13658 RepID=A0A915KQF6_ROMCU